MQYSMQCPVDGCDFVMQTETDSEDVAVSELMRQGNDHFAEVGHPMDQSMTPQMQEQMTRQNMRKS